MSAPRLSKQARNEIVSRYLAGEKVVVIALEFGVHQSYPALLAKRRGIRLRAPNSARDRMSERAHTRAGT